MKFLHSFLFLAIYFTSFGQNYWQQEVNYTIQVALDDEHHLLRGYEEFEYVNNSPDELTEIYMHIWPNAYRNGNTALAKQLYADGNGILKFAADSIKGSIDSLDFQINGEKISWDYHPEHIDICVIKLPIPLKPGERISVTTPFNVKIPSGDISRLGHIGQSYQITQWYPKPAVYDRNGWNAFPYLNQGEFYSEYGSFDVSITLPENYIVGATGDLQTESEIAFLNEHAQMTQDAIDKGDFYVKLKGLKNVNDFPASSSTLKTIRFTQKNVHDFAWFADKRYQVLKSEVVVPHSNRTVTSWAMYTPKNSRLWSKSSEYLNDAIHYYSKWNGDYPYNQVTAVDGTISAGGGMEYPNVTVIGNAGDAQTLEVVIVHEVGHNWFYGQLGSNERVHGWMDEGMNTLNEIRYMQTKYPDNTAMSDMVFNGSFHFNDLDHHDMSDFSYRFLARIGEDQPIETHSAEFTSINYGIVMYQKTGLVFYYLKDYLGDDLFDQCMQEYYRKWEFKHPQPEDMRKAFEDVSGKELSWVFEDLIQTTDHVDYKICAGRLKNGTTKVKVKNVGQVDGPIEVVAIKGNKEVESKWIEPGNKKSTLEFTSDLDRVVIDPDKDIPEINRQNNSWRANGVHKKIEKPKLEFFIGDNETEYSNIFWTPAIGANDYDKFMLGAAIHNYGLPMNKFNFFVVPMYSFGRKFVSGFGEFSYSFLPRTGLKKSTFGLSVKSFKEDTSSIRNDAYYVGIAPYWTAKIGNRGPKSPISQSIRIQGIYRMDVRDTNTTEHSGAFIQYDLQFKKPDHVVDFQIRNDYYSNLNSWDYMSRIMVTATYKWKYLRKSGRWIELRGFAGRTYDKQFAGKTYQYNPYGMSLSGTAGYQDLFLEDYYFGRNAISGLSSQQRMENMGGFKSTAWYGTTSEWMVTTNLYVQLPVPGGILGLYGDYGVFHNGTAVNSAYDAGIGIRLGSIFGIYFPMVMSTEMIESYGSDKMFDNYGEKIRFTLRLNPFNKELNISSLLN